MHRIENLYTQSVLGQMGLGIAYVSALRARVSVVLTDKSQAQVTSGLNLFDKLLKKDVEKGRIKTEEAKEVRDRIQVVPDLKGMRDADMVVEVSFYDIPFRKKSLKGI